MLEAKVEGVEEDTSAEEARAANGKQRGGSAAVGGLEGGGRVARRAGGGQVVGELGVWGRAGAAIGFNPMVVNKM